MSSASLSRVVLSYPTPISLADTGTGHPMSWMQVARTGNFVSQRYGKFSITRGDLAQMLNNFKTITPKAPTMLPVDFDHLSMDPKKPGDGMAAGWMKDLVLRSDGDELWGLVEWTPTAARQIQNKEYQFVSPSFVKDYIYKDGNDIGTTLLAAAITNHPFLEGMAALTLSAGLSEMAHIYTLGDNPFAKKDDDGDAGSDKPAAPAPAANPQAAPPQASAPHAGGSMQAGQKVSVKDDEVQKPEQMGVTFTIRQVVGEGADAFVSLQAPDGTVAEWFRADELQPAPAVVAQPQQAASMAQTPGATPQAMTPQIPSQLPSAPVGTGITQMSTLPEVEGKSLAETLPEVQGKDLAATLPEVEGTDLTATLPEVEGKDLAATLPEVEGKDLAATLPEVEGKDLAATLPEVQTKSLSSNASQENPMKTFELSDVTGAKFTVNEDQIAAITDAAAKAAGTVVVNLADYQAMQGKVTTLSEQIEIMANAAAAAEKRARTIELHNELDRLSKGALITKTERGWAEKVFADATDLSSFKEWAATKTVPVVRLNTEVGSGLAGTKSDGESAADSIMELAQKISKEQRIPYRDAMIKASKQMADEAEAYREQFSTTVN